MTEKIKVAILFGGQSAEHEVSLQSAKNILEAIDKSKYEVALVGIDKDGRWYLNESSNFLLNSNNPKLIALNINCADTIGIIPGKNASQLIKTNSNDNPLKEVDVVFPVLHGPLGEDGTIQGLLRLANVAFVGANVLGSAVAMDKEVMKRLLRDSGLPIGNFMTVRSHELESFDFGGAGEKLGYPLFVKPANMGSSVGVVKVTDQGQLKQALNFAAQFDNKVIIEEFIDGREIEVAVLGNQEPEASVPGEIVPQNDFYSYEAKYIDESGANLEIPAKLDEDTVAALQLMAIQTFKCLECEGMGRVDFFLKKNGDIIINEINSIPGFTKISMYPRLWQESGISYGDLIDKLIELAQKRHQKSSSLKTSIE